MELAASKEIGVGEVGTQVEVATTDGGGDDEEWLDAIASTTVPNSATVDYGVRAASDDPGVATDSAGGVTREGALLRQETALPAIPVENRQDEEEHADLVVVQAADSVFEVVPRICEDANN
jgi:hypothetical protein